MSTSSWSLGITESRGLKSDKRDAYALAEKLRVGNLEKSVFKAPRQFTRLRELSRIADLLREIRKHPIVGILETAPGFGPIRAARLVPIVVTPHRFRTRRQFWSYCGLGIVTRSSSDWVQAADGGWIKARVSQTRGLSRQHNRFLKHVFKGAATTVITQRNKDPIHARYQRLVDGGTKPTLAKLSLARMIAATVLRTWKDEEEYDPGRAVQSAETREG